MAIRISYNEKLGVYWTNSFLYFENPLSTLLRIVWWTSSNENPVPFDTCNFRYF